MSRTLTIVEHTQNRSVSSQAGNWFVIQGKFDELAPLGLIDKEVSVAGHPLSIADATVKNGVLSVKLDGPTASNIQRGAKIEIP